MRSKLALICALSMAAAMPNVAQAAEGLMVDKPEADINDMIKLETDILQQAPYRDDQSGRYEVWFWFCRDTPQNCADRTKAKWWRVPVTDGQGRPVQPMRAYVCTRRTASGHCEVRVRLTNPREVTYSFAAVVHDTQTNKQAWLSELKKVVFKKMPPPKQEKPVSGKPRMTITAFGKTCIAELSERGKTPEYQCIEQTTRKLQPGGVVPPEQLTVTLEHMPNKNWNAVRFMWAGNPKDTRGFTAPVVCPVPCSRTLGGLTGYPPTLVEVTATSIQDPLIDLGEDPYGGAMRALNGKISITLTK